MRKLSAPLLIIVYIFLLTACKGVEVVAPNSEHMQVHVRLYKAGALYDEFAFNAVDGKYQTKTSLTSSTFESTDDPEGLVEKLVNLVIRVNDDDYSIAMLIPVHQSTEWEIVKISEVYTVGFYCIKDQIY